MRHSFYLLIWIPILLCACNVNHPLSTPAPTPLIPTPSPLPTQSSPTKSPKTGIFEANVGAWQTLSDGLEWRLYVPEDGDIATMLALRINPQTYHFRALYNAGNPLTVRQWAQQDSKIVALVNANFFDEQNQVLGLLVSDGAVFGTSYQGRGGTFVVENGIASVRSTTANPYQGQPLEQAVQAFPMLVQDGVSTYSDRSTEQITRRTVIGQDRDGNIILLVTPLLGPSLADLSAYLPTTDLNLVNAFNLDGGGSTMMAIPSIDYYLPSLDPVPAILAVYQR